MTSQIKYKQFFENTLLDVCIMVLESAARDACRLWRKSTQTCHHGVASHYQNSDDLNSHGILWLGAHYRGTLHG